MESESDKNLQAALQYLGFGWAVFPCWEIGVSGKCKCGSEDCKSPGKHPIPRHGVKDATKREEVARNWWTSYPNANIAIATGEESRIFVLDVDGEKGIADLAKLEISHGALPKTFTARTGGGGLHFFFAYPPSGEIKNRTRMQGRSIDCRGNGGYVVAPPSNHKSGSEYLWETSPGEMPIARAPEWLLDLIQSPSDSPKEEDAASPEQLLDQMTEGLDLDTAAGAPSGKRHDRALRLIGSHLGRKEPPFSVLRKARS